MSFDYSIAGEWADFIHALAIGESNENPLAVGDGNRALGILQQHPAFFQEYYGRGSFPASVADTWVQAQIKAAASFFEVWMHLGVDLVVQAYNLGAEAVLKGARNPQYLERFTENLNKVRGISNTGRIE